MTSDPFEVRNPMLAPSILSADFSRLDREIEEVLGAGADFLHLDVMDGHFVPNISFGPAVIKSIRKLTDAYFDAHLMISEPLKYAQAFARAGCDGLTFHVETTDRPAEVAKEIRKLGVDVGVTLNPATAVEALWPALEFVDHVLVMSVVPGFSGQKFMPEVLGKVMEIKKRIRGDQRIEIDGGINLETAGVARKAGVDWFVVASAIFDQTDRMAAIGGLRGVIGE